MAKHNRFDDLDEMLVPIDPSKDVSEDVADDHHKPKKEKKPSKKDAGKPPRQLEKEAKQRAERIRLIAICASIFVVMIAGLIAVGFAMGERAGVNNKMKKATPDPNRTMFSNNAATPDMDPSGFQGVLTEAYFTTKGDLALTFRLSNGMAEDQKLLTMDVLVFNDKGENVAKQLFEKFRPEVIVPSQGFEEVYVVVDKKNVLKPDDTLISLGSTVHFTGMPTGEKAQASDPDDPKAIAPDRTYFEAPGNMPPLSAEGVKGGIVRAQYTNDGSLAVTVSFSNGTPTDRKVTGVTVSIANGNGVTVAEQSFSSFDTPCVVNPNSYNQTVLYIDAANVPVKDDPLNSLSCTVSVSADEVAPAATTAADAAPTEAATAPAA